MIIGQKAWTQLRKHKEIVAGVGLDIKNPGRGKAVSDKAIGLATRRAVAELLELDEIIVGRAFYNTAARGAAANISRLWGNHAALIYTAPIADPAMPTLPVFGWTAEYRPLMVRAYPEHKIAPQGGEAYEVSQICREQAGHKGSGYFLQNVIA